MSEYAEIIERLEKATGPDRLIDVLTAYAADYVVEDISLRERMDRHGVEYMLEKVENSYNSVWQLLPRYTASIDAAIALVEKMLPRHCLSLNFDNCKRAYVYKDDEYNIAAKFDEWVAYADAETMPLAILLALFRALEGKEPRYER